MTRSRWLSPWKLLYAVLATLIAAASAVALAPAANALTSYCPSMQHDLLSCSLTVSGGTATAEFTFDGGVRGFTYSLAAYTKPPPADAASYPQTLFASSTDVFGPGPHTLTVALPCGDYQVDFIMSVPVPSLPGPVYTPANRLLGYILGSRDCGPPPTPGITITKTASTTQAAPFQSVTYTYRVTNTGNVPLTGVGVVDDNGTPANTADDVTVGTVASLEPGVAVALTRTLTLPGTSLASGLGAVLTSSFAVLSLGGDAGHTNAGINCSLATVYGNVGVAGYGFFNNMAPCTETGALYKGSAVTVRGPGKLQGGVITDDALMTQLRTDALNAAAYFKALPATQTVPGGAITTSLTLTGTPGLNVIDVSQLKLGHGDTLTLTGPADTQWVINDAGDFAVDAGRIALGPNLTSADVLFNITDPAAGVRTHGPNVSTGILLAPYNTIRIGLGPWTGEVIGGLNHVIKLISGPKITAPTVSPATLTNVATATATGAGLTVSATGSATVTISR